MPLPTSRELREMLEEATPGPWRADEAATCECCTHVRASATLVCTPDMTDAPLIALAPQLAEEVIRLREEIDRVKELCLNRCRSAEAAEDSASKGAGLYLEGQQVAYYEAYLQLDKALHGEKQRD